LNQVTFDLLRVDNSYDMNGQGQRQTSKVKVKGQNAVANVVGLSLILDHTQFSSLQVNSCT